MFLISFFLFWCSVQIENILISILINSIIFIWREPLQFFRFKVIEWHFIGIINNHFQIFHLFDKFPELVFYSSQEFQVKEKPLEKFYQNIPSNSVLETIRRRYLNDLHKSSRKFQFILSKNLCLNQFDHKRFVGSLGKVVLISLFALECIVFHVLVKLKPLYIAVWNPFKIVFLMGVNDLLRLDRCWIRGLRENI